MKKILTVLAIFLVSASLAHAQFGILGGFTSSYTSLDSKALENAKNVSLFHAGFAYKIKMGPLFALQPALTYQVKGANVDMGASNLYIKSQFVEASVGAHIGVDLLVFRPFIMVEPFIGYEVATSPVFSMGGASIDEYKTLLNKEKNRLDLGFGVGGGVELLNHVQISVQWFMNAGEMFQDDAFNTNAIQSIVNQVTDYNTLKDVKNYQGIKVSLGIFF